MSTTSESYGNQSAPNGSRIGEHETAPPGNTINDNRGSNAAESHRNVQFECNLLNAERQVDGRGENQAQRFINHWQPSGYPLSMSQQRGPAETPGKLCCLSVNAP